MIHDSLVLVVTMLAFAGGWAYCTASLVKIMFKWLYRK